MRNQTPPPPEARSGLIQTVWGATAQCTLLARQRDGRSGPTPLAARGSSPTQSGRRVVGRCQHVITAGAHVRFKLDLGEGAEARLQAAQAPKSPSPCWPAVSQAAQGAHSRAGAAACIPGTTLKKPGPGVWARRVGRRRNGRLDSDGTRNRRGAYRSSTRANPCRATCLGSRRALCSQPRKRLGALP